MCPMMWRSLTAKFSTKLIRKSNMAVHVPVDTSEARTFAIEMLKSGGAIALPTDTIYGIACDATNVDAINKLYSIKCRNENKPLAICLGDVDDVRKWAVVNHLPVGLLPALLPGPVTLILQSSNKLLDKSLICDKKVGVRIPNYNFIRCVANGLGKPLALTSANLSTRPSSVKIEEFQILWEKLDGVFDGGVLTSSSVTRSGSTIVDLSKKGSYSIIRTGMALQSTCSILNEFGLRSLSI